jgi:hypothetical protein
LLDLIVFLSVLVALAKLFDVLMSDAQKSRFSDTTYSFWNWIDDCKKGIRTRLSARPSFKQIISSLFFCILFVIFGTLILVSSNMIDITVLSYVIWGFGFLIALVGLLPIYVLWYVVAVIIFLFIITPIVRMLELVVRRIAEAPKGPVFAISAICGALAEILKVVI